MTLYLIAYVTNAQSAKTAEVELEVASHTPDNRWITSSHLQVLPFWTQEITFAIPPIPEGWLEKMQLEADHYASTRHVPKVSLADALGLNLRPQSAQIRRRV